MFDVVGAAHELVKSGDTIYVTDSTGRTTKGKLGNLSSASLELLVRKAAPDGRETLLPEVRLSEAQVRQILLQRRDPSGKVRSSARQLSEDHGS